MRVKVKTIKPARQYIQDILVVNEEFGIKN